MFLPIFRYEYNNLKRDHKKETFLKSKLIVHFLEFKMNFSKLSFLNKKPRHPAGVFRMGSLGITPVVPYSPCAYRCSYYCVELPVPDESIIKKFQEPGQPQRAGIVVSICVQDRLKTVPGLSAEIADNFRSAGIELSGKKRSMGVF